MSCPTTSTHPSPRSFISNHNLAFWTLPAHNPITHILPHRPHANTATTTNVTRMGKKRSSAQERNAFQQIQQAQAHVQQPGSISPSQSGSGSGGIGTVPGGMPVPTRYPTGPIPEHGSDMSARRVQHVTSVSAQNGMLF